MMEVRLLKEGEPLPMPLLLEADPSEKMIRNYIMESDILIAEEERRAVGVCVLLPLSLRTAEIKNIAVAGPDRGRGIAKALIAEALKQAKDEGFRSVEIGTGNSSLGQLALYQKCGFRMTGIDRDYFIRHYPEPIFENGIWCRDMVKLEYLLENLSF